LSGGHQFKRIPLIRHPETVGMMSYNEYRWYDYYPMKIQKIEDQKMEVSSSCEWVGIGSTIWEL
jgi:hypothetical protein